jgi:predicted N-acetyltransferase YhbS
MHIDYLADHMEFVPILADWHHQEWKESTVEQTAAELRTHTQRRHVPTTLVAIENGLVIGSTSLLVADLEGWEHFTPWVASVFVAPAWRGRGIGKALVTRASEEANLLGIPTIYLFTASKENYYTRLGFQSVERAPFKGKEIVIMQRPLGAETHQDAVSADECCILKQLDGLVAISAIRRQLLQIADRVTQKLSQEIASTMAWESLPLEIYGDALPPTIRSSWVFVLRSAATTGAERHPNSHQRVMSLRGSGDLQTGGPGRWQSHLLVSDENADLLSRWATISPNIWHQAVVPSQDWAVVSFHTAAAVELIEERPCVNDAEMTHQRRYLDP